MNEQIDNITLHNDKFIKGFFNEYRWLSNYHVCDIEYEGRLYTSSEAAYQSAKNSDEFIKSQIQKMTPLESKKYSKKYQYEEIGMILRKK